MALEVINSRAWPSETSAASSPIASLTRPTTASALVRVTAVAAISGARKIAEPATPMVSTAYCAASAGSFAANCANSADQLVTALLS